MTPGSVLPGMLPVIMAPGLNEYAWIDQIRFEAIASRLEAIATRFLLLVGWRPSPVAKCC